MIESPSGTKASPMKTQQSQYKDSLAINSRRSVHKRDTEMMKEDSIPKK